MKRDLILLRRLRKERLSSKEVEELMMRYVFDDRFRDLVRFQETISDVQDRYFSEENRSVS
ncbi:MAG: hypothetical protein R6T99_03005 [Bacteroidales bacterium]